MEVWVLTEEVNDYNQYGEYFLAVFREKPTLEELMSFDIPEDYAQSCLDTGGKRLRPTVGCGWWWSLKSYNI